MEVLHKRMKTTEGSEGEGGEAAWAEDEAPETNLAPGSEEMEANIQAILERIERFTQQVSEMLEAGKELFSNLSAQYEDRLITIHRDHVEKWQEEIKELRMLDTSNEAGRALLQNAQLHLIQSVTEENS